MEQKSMKAQMRKENNLVLHNAATGKAATITKIIKDSSTFWIKLVVGKNITDERGNILKEATVGCEVRSAISDVSKHEERIELIPSETFLMDLFTVLYKHKLLSDAHEVELATINVANAQNIREVRANADKHAALMKDTLNVSLQAAYDESNKKVDALVAENKKAIETKNKQYKKL